MVGLRARDGAVACSLRGWNDAARTAQCATSSSGLAFFQDVITSDNQREQGLHTPPTPSPQCPPEGSTEDIKATSLNALSRFTMGIMRPAFRAPAMEL